MVKNAKIMIMERQVLPFPGVIIIICYYVGKGDNCMFCVIFGCNNFWGKLIAEVGEKNGHIR